MIKRQTLLINLAGGQIDLDLVALLHGWIQIRAFDNREAVVDRIAIERSCEGARHHGLDPHPLNGRRGLFPRAAASEIPAGHQDLEVAQLGRILLA